MLKNNQISQNPIRESMAAISVGICNDEFLLDLDYNEDSTAQVDANFVLTESGKIVEIQGTAEGEPFSKDDYAKLMDLAYIGVEKLVTYQKEAIQNAKI